MSHNRWASPQPIEFRGLNVNVHRSGDAWVVEITPNPFTCAEALRPPWVAVFPVSEVPVDEVFTLAQFLSLTSMVLEDIAAERREPLELIRSL